MISLDSTADAIYGGTTTAGDINTTGLFREASGFFFQVTQFMGSGYFETIQVKMILYLDDDPAGLQATASHQFTVNTGQLYMLPVEYAKADFLRQLYFITPSAVPLGIKRAYLSDNSSTVVQPTVDEFRPGRIIRGFVSGVPGTYFDYAGYKWLIPSTSGSHRFSKVGGTGKVQHDGLYGLYSFLHQFDGTYVEGGKTTPLADWEAGKGIESDEFDQAGNAICTGITVEDWNNNVVIT